MKNYLKEFITATAFAESNRIDKHGNVIHRPDEYRHYLFGEYNEEDVDFVRWCQEYKNAKPLDVYLLGKLGDIESALNTAISALYFNDGSDYRNALEQIAAVLSGNEGYLADEEVKELFKTLNGDEFR